MESDATSRSSNASAWGWPPFAVAAALLGFLLPLVHRPLLLDGDTYWHLAAGQWMLDHGAIPHTDPFSASMPGAPWVAHEWLSEVMMALAFGAGGWSGLQLLCSVTLATVLGMCAHYVRGWLDQPAALVVGTVTAFAIVTSLFARPHLIALIPLAVWSIALLRAREQQRLPSWWLLLLMVAWANLHGSFVLGLVLAGVLAIEAILEAPGLRTALAGRWATFLAAAALASMCTPFGWHSLWYPFQLMQPELTAYIAEWQPPNFRRPQPLTLAITALLYTACTRPVRLPLIRLLLLLALLWQAFQHSRHEMVAAVVGSLILAAPLGQSLACARAAPRGPRHTLRWVAVAVAVAALATTLRLSLPVLRGDDPATPATALAQVPPSLRAQPVFNSYEFGGYLIYRQLRPFVDGRADMYGAPFMAAYIAPFQSNRPAFEDLVQRYDLRWALIAADSAPLLYLLDTLPRWHRLYGDGVAVVYVRDN